MNNYKRKIIKTLAKINGIYLKIPYKEDEKQ